MLHDKFQLFFIFILFLWKTKEPFLFFHILNKIDIFIVNKIIYYVYIYLYL